ncbi:hypothetical protein QBZ16_001655 [Prototheca wickerhamii]|uniref:Uncharacterized protein n=1 Tax=Prototheca wickerhamii TaxID=3111 RepID=A0AAD9IFX0_PROWI|nr:hypothetical protein QBZ16_001655 [Prototheca wickerhamii]
MTAPPSAFHLYELRAPEIQFGIRFEQLLAAFGLFSAGPGVAEVTLQYPGRGAELVIRSWHAQEVTFAHLGAVELPGSAPRLDQHWEGAVASFIAPGALLRDAVDDLDWAGKSARIRVSRDPAGLSFLSSDQTLRLEVEVPMAQLLGFSCQPGTHQATYSLRFLSTALLAHTASGSSPAAGATKVAMDSQGLLKVTHLLNLSDAGRVARVSHPLVPDQSQTPDQSPADCVLLFTILPSVEAVQA